jgi:D-alanyl-D-alanine carboxypeptidase/D-alanyl-D-alanine-endopeptidase (penicillin-binding protein 4)
VRATRAITAIAALATLAASTAAVAAPSTACADSPGATRLAARLGRALVAPGLDLCRTSALAVDLRSGKAVFAHRASLALAPASNEKLVVTFAALVRLGPGYRFHTELAATGRLDGTTWRGDLYLRGFGDPTFAQPDLASLAAQVRAWGIRRVSGSVLGDESWFDRRRDASGWRASFLGEESPPLSALVVDRGHGWPALSTALLAARALSLALERHGISVAGRPGLGTTPADAFPLAQDLSKPLAAVVRTMNRESDNFAAELLLKTLGAELAGSGTTAAGARVARAALAEAGVSLAGVRLADGSGLSQLDRLSATCLVALLRTADSSASIRDAFLSSLAVAGVSGTLERRLDRRPAYGQVIGKTGTTRLASSLSGFVRGKYVFAVLQNGSPVPTWTARSAQDAFALELARAE